MVERGGCTIHRAHASIRAVRIRYSQRGSCKGCRTERRWYSLVGVDAVKDAYFVRSTRGLIKRGYNALTCDEPRQDDDVRMRRFTAE
jgi:hypothetical protein